MNENFIALLELYSCAIGSEKTEEQNIFDLEEVIKLAENQGVLPIVMPVLKKIDFVSQRDDFKQLYNKMKN